MKGTQLTCAKMRLSSPSQYCVQLRSRAPTSAEGERNNLEKLSHFLFIILSPSDSPLSQFRTTSPPLSSSQDYSCRGAGEGTQVWLVAIFGRSRCPFCGAWRCSLLWPPASQQPSWPLPGALGLLPRSQGTQESGVVGTAVVGLGCPPPQCPQLWPSSLPAQTDPPQSHLHEGSWSQTLTLTHSQLGLGLASPETWGCVKSGWRRE